MAAGIGKMLCPSQKANTEASLPAKYRSIKTVSPASPNAFSSIRRQMPARAASRVSQISTPFSGREPVRLQNYWEFRLPFDISARLYSAIKHCDSAVRTPYSRIKLLANDLLPSNRAAARGGPNTLKPAASSSSTSPSASGFSGPTITKSTASCRAACSGCRSQSAGGKIPKIPKIPRRLLPVIPQTALIEFWITQKAGRNLRCHSKRATAARHELPFEEYLGEYLPQIPYIPWQRRPKSGSNFLAKCLVKCPLKCYGQSRVRGRPCRQSKSFRMAQALSFAAARAAKLSVVLAGYLTKLDSMQEGQIRGFRPGNAC